MEFSRVFGSLIDVSRILRHRVGIGRNLTLVEFSGILRLVESGGFLRRRVDISGNLRLVDLSGFPRF